VDKHLSNFSVAGHGGAGIAGVGRGQEKFTFLYVVFAAVAITCSIAFSLYASLAWTQSLLLLIGSVLVATAIVFVSLEVRRDSRGGKTSAGESFNEGVDPYGPTTVELRPPTGEPYPHHEYFKESQGLDQGQLTARIPDSTPFLDAMLERRRRAKETAHR